MKKVVIAVLVVGLLSVAGTAMAKNNRGQKGYLPPNGACWQQTNPAGDPMGGKGCHMFQGQGRQKGPGYARGGMRGWNVADMPEDIRAKANELAKLQIDLRDVLSRTPIDRAKATELHGKTMQLRQEVGAWAFGQKMNRIEEFRKQQELNRTVTPGTPAPAPAPKS